MIFKHTKCGAYTEWLVSTRMGMALAPASTKGYDAITSGGRKIQIKSRKNNAKNKSNDTWYNSKL